jgi:hypothetical protein
MRKTRALYSTDAARRKLEFLFSDDHLRTLDQGVAVEQAQIATLVEADFGSKM